MPNKALVIYHAQCRDGQAAGYIAVSALRKQGYTVVHIPCAYGGPVPNVDGFDLVYIVDFSFKRDVLADMCKAVTRLVLVDHHKTAQADLTSWDDKPANLEINFDMTRCGARLTYDHFGGDSYLNLGVPSDMIDYIQDRDLWTWSLPRSHEVSAWVSSFSEGLDSFGAMAILFQDIGVEGAAAAGEAIIGYQKQVVDKHLKSVEVMNLLGHKVAVVNATTMISEVCHEALAKFPEADFAMSWQDLVKDNKRVFSLRSRKGGVDVSEVAKKLGGGGHANAAGFTIKMPHLKMPQLKLWLDDGY